MKSKILILLATLMALTSVSTLFGCFSSPTDPQIPDYNADIEIVLPENIDSEHFIVEEDTTYYTSPGFSLMMEVNGLFREMDYFSLDGNKRVYDNLYLYKKDYFFMITDDYKDIYASLGDTNDLQYGEEEKESGYDIQINVKKSGIYKLIFDTDTLKFDMVYKDEITTPVYYTMPNCTILGGESLTWTDLQVNPNNPDEFYIENYYIPVNTSIAFLPNSHVSFYKVTLDETCNDKLGYWNYPSVIVNVGGNYNVYVNKKTYVVRLELLNPETADYTCTYYANKDLQPLTAYDQSMPYLFTYRMVVDKVYTSIPEFYTTRAAKYKLTPKSSPYLLVDSDIFKTTGIFDIKIDLLNFEVSVEKLPE
ncbi:MAG: hypothetical protein IJZ73_06595 [Clostridia bacterium]|nr:hypothetical protein [Clostridia bacterium]